MSIPPLLSVHVGPVRHGVTRYGAQLARAGSHAAAAQNVRLASAADQERLAETCRSMQPAVCHFHFTDQLYGRDPLTAAAGFESLAESTGAAMSVVTLHDVPPPIGFGLDQRRACYRAVVDHADAVIVSSWHEADRLRRFTKAVPTVIPHFVEARARTRFRSSRQRPSVGVLGFIYPGKGHEEVIIAAGTRPDVDVVAIGGPPPRHPGLVTQLRDAARLLGVRLEITGWVDEHRLDSYLTDISVAIVSNHDISASGSLATWLGAQRRPLVRSGPYALELAARAPGCMTLYDPDDPESLTRAISVALRDPTSTWQDCVPDELRPERIARLHASLFDELA